MGQRGEVYTDRLDIPNGKRCYFFNIKENRSGDYFINIVESINRLDSKFDRQEILLYEEHLDLFQEKFNKLVNEMRLLCMKRDEVLKKKQE